MQSSASHTESAAVGKIVRRPTLAVLLVTHNRRNTTLRAVAALKNCHAFSLKLVVFDDASTDGTPKAIRTAWPDARIISGEGDAFWNGGLYRAWTEALSTNSDAYLWLNDDVVLDGDAFEKLRAEWDARSPVEKDECILIGATRGSHGEPTYGGLIASRKPTALHFELAPVRDRTFEVDTFNGNIVLVPRSVVTTIGINDPRYFHNFGDIDYGLRATREGIRVLQLAGTLGICDANDAKKLTGYGSPKLSIIEQWRKVDSHHGLPPRSWWIFTRQHSGPWWPVHFLLPYRHLLKFWRMGAKAQEGG